jgi:hypothetical protein
LRDLFVPAQTFERIVNQGEYFVILQGSGLVRIVFIENSVNRLSELIVGWFAHSFLESNCLIIY